MLLTILMLEGVIKVYSTITHKHYECAEQLLAWNTVKDVLNGKLRPHWLGEEGRFWYRRDVRKGNENGRQFVVVDPVRNTKEPAFDHVKLSDGLSQATGHVYQPEHLPFDSFSYVNEGRAIQFKVEETNWICDLDQYECRQGKPSKEVPPHESCSPDGSWAVFVKENNLYLRCVKTGEIKPLTVDGEPYYDYGTQPEVRTSAIFERLYHQNLPPVVLWSPDSKKLLTHRLDQRKVRTMHLLQSHPLDETKAPEVHAYRYPLVGDKHLPQVKFVVFDIEQGCMIPIETEPVITGLMSPLTPELQTAFWTDDSSSFYFMRMSRDYRSVQFVAVDSNTGKACTLLEEKSETFLFTDLYNLGFGKINIRWLSKRNDFIWHSERDGWSHLYLYDGCTGALKNRITSGSLVVRGLISVDEEKGWVYFTAGGQEPGRDPYYQHLYRVRLDGTELMLLTPEDAEHDVFISPDHQYFVDTFSRVDLPPMSVLRRTDGSLVRHLEEADIEHLLKKGYQIPERFTVKATDGITDLYGILIRPAMVEADTKYPILDYVYGGPQRSHTPKRFTWGGEMHVEPIDLTGGAQTFAQLGFAVILMDGRGTPYREKAFHDYSNGRLERAAGLEDHEAAIKQLTERYSFLDGDRVGTYGESGGGYGAARAILTYPDTYKVAVAGCGNHDQRFYLASWGERFQGKFDSELYQEQDNTRLVDRLKGKLLLATGDMDDNVHPASTIRMVHALIKANKDFDFLLIPNRHHGIAADVYFIRRRWDYFVKHLLETEPPNEYNIQDPIFPR